MARDTIAVVPAKAPDGTMAAVIIDARYSFVLRWVWRVTWSGHCYRNQSYREHGVKKCRRVYLHRFIMQCPDGLVVDHLNADPLDNRVANLEIVTHAENTLRGGVPHVAEVEA